MAQTIKLKRSGTAGAAPSTSDLALGEVAINTYDGKMFIKKSVSGSDSIVELGTGAGGEATYSKTTVTATNGQTTVSSLSYTAGLVEVYLNGARLVVGTDVTATNGNSIVLATGAAVNDIIQVVAFKASDAFSPTSPTFTGTTTSPIINASTTLQISGVAITSTASELNLLDGVSTTVAELNILDNATVTTAELNILDGVTATTAELNILDGVTATAAELNILDGVTATSAELNYIDGVTSNIQTQLGSASPKVTAVASGTLANGDTICVNAAGTVSAITGTSATQGVGTVAPFNDDVGSTVVYYPDLVYNTDTNQMILFWENNGAGGSGVNKGYASVGTVSGTSITWGAPVVYKDSSGNAGVSGCYDPDTQRVIVVWKGGATADWAGTLNYIYATVGQVSGTGASATITFGAYQTLSTEIKNEQWCVYDQNSNKVVVGYTDGSGSRQGKIIVGTVNGANKTLSFGSEQTFNATGRTNTTSRSVHYDPDAGKVCAFYQDYSDSESGKCTVFSWNSSSSNYDFVESQFDTGNIQSAYIASCYDTTANKSVVFYQRQSSSYMGKVNIGTMNGSTMDFGTAKIIVAKNQTKHVDITHDATTGKNVLIYDHTPSGSDAIGYLNTGTVSGTGANAIMTMDTEVTMESLGMGARIESPSIEADLNSGKVVVTFNDQSDVSNLGSGKSHVWTTGYFSSNATPENYIGISDGAYSNGQTATIQIIGAVDDAQSSLTPGQTYYVKADGSLSLTPETTSIRAGTAITATKIIVKG